MNFPNDLHYTASHEWVRSEADGSVTVGITDLAQDSLGELVYVDLPALGKTLAAAESCAVVESTKAASDSASISSSPNATSLNEIQFSFFKPGRHERRSQISMILFDSRCSSLSFSKYDAANSVSCCS